MEAGKITEAERDVLLGKPVKQEVVAQNSSIKPRRQPPTPTLQPHQLIGKAEQPTEEICFTYRIKGAKAHAVYCPSEGTWTVRAGSTARAETKTYANGVRRRRQALLENGSLIHLDSTYLEYVEDVRYTSSSSAADDISGASKNGWAVWLDADGRPAQHHRLKNQPD